jgi:NADPH:quinone reductase-like Zn-dependent oxidoreductase
MREVPSLLRRNAVPEMDFSGHVVLAGPTANPALSPGMKVFGTISPASGLLSGAGSLAEYIVIPSDLVQTIPPNVRLDEAATLGGLAQTALKMVETAGVVQRHWIMIHGASGGVGIVATQLAKAKGATVVATCSACNIDMVKAAGADEVSLKDLCMTLFCCYLMMNLG